MNDRKKKKKKKKKSGAKVAQLARKTTINMDVYSLRSKTGKTRWGKKSRWRQEESKR